MINRSNSAAFILVSVLGVATVLAYGTVHPPMLSLFYLATLVLALLWATESWQTRTIQFSRSLLQVPLIAFAAYALIQSMPFGYRSEGSIAGIPTTISADPFASQSNALHLFALAVVLSAALIYINSAKRLRKVVAMATVFGFAYAFFAILQSVLSPDAIYGIYRPRAIPFGSFVNRNDFAAVMVMFTCLPLGMLFSGTVAREKRLLYVFAVALMATSILLSRSRGGLVALVVEVIALVIFSSRAHGRKKLLLKLVLSAALILTAVSGAVFVGGETSFNRLTAGDLATEAPTETTSRFHMWDVTTKIIGRNLVFGSGIGAFPALYPHYDDGSGTDRVEQAHNDYLQVLSDAGLIGAAIGLFFLYGLVQQGRASIRARNSFRRGVAVGALAGVVAVLVHSLFDFVLHITGVSVIFLTLMAVLVASGREFEDDIPDTDEPRGHRRKANTSPIRRRDSGRI
jgi:O-antigen ligase